MMKYEINVKSYRVSQKKTIPRFEIDIVYITPMILLDVILD